MNGDKKNKWRGGIYGAFIMAIIYALVFAFGYGVLNSKVEALEEKTECIKEIHKDIATIKNDIAWIKDNG